MIMKIPTSGSGNGYYGHETSVIPYLSDGSDVTNGEDVDSPTLDGDFSEYMWMENEEEFDKQVMQQLEEEALMEQCIEAMLEDEREALTGTGETTQQWSTNTEDPLCQGLEGLRVQDDLAKQSTLNPNAAEFVPKRTEPSAPPEPLASTA